MSAFKLASEILLFLMVVVLMVAIIRVIVSRYLTGFYEGVFRKSHSLYKKVFKDSK